MNITNIALSGLNASRVALDVTAQNVANVNTPGYSRQQALMASVAGSAHDKLDAGMGVEVTSIRRVTDDFLVKQTWSTGSALAHAENYSSNFEQLENTLGADGFSISAGLDSLFAALHDATVKPESLPLRQQIINESEALARRFNMLSETLYNQHRDLSEQRTSEISHANSLLVNIADVNKRIVEMQGAGGNPAQLMDTRDLLLTQLSQEVEIRTTTQSNGGIQVSLVTGQPLVIGGDYGQLQAVPHDDDAYMADLKVEFGKQSFAVKGSVGGKIGAINDFQQNVLKSNQISLDDMAASLANKFNEVLEGGADLNNEDGVPLFKFDPEHPASSIDLDENITPEKLALAAGGSDENLPGNSDTLAELIKVSNEPFEISGLGQVSLNDAFTSMLGGTAIKARQASSDYSAQDAMNKQAVAARDNVSAVNSDEEAANLMTFANAHNANMKVISTANQLFDSVLQLF